MADQNADTLSAPVSAAPAEACSVMDFEEAACGTLSDPSLARPLS